MRLHVLAAAALFAIAFGVRWWLRQGLVLGDDPQEFAALLHILSNGPLLADQLHLRFGGWVFNHLGFWLLGVSETSFLLPTALVTSTFSIMAYAILLRWEYGRLRAFLGGLLVALAPFEVVLGSLRANDSYLELAIAVGFTALVLLERRPVWQGIAVAVCLWFGFYVKLWVVYALPALGLYYLVGRRWRAAASMTVTSLILHGVTCVYWYTRVHTFFPFISFHAANYPVPPADLPELFLKYLRLIFVGSFEFPTTLWGWAPHVLVVLVGVKLLGTTSGRLPEPLRLDRRDRLLGTLWLSFFLFLEFFPNGFQLDAYYSVPRIFRYLAPLSFPVALHAAKCVLDVTRVPMGGLPGGAVAVGLVAPLLALYVSQAVQANGPSRLYHETLHAILEDVRTIDPPALIGESVLASYFRDLYLDPNEQQTRVYIVSDEHSAAEYERYLQAQQPTMPDGTLLITGLGSFIHYGAHIDGFRLAWFTAPLSPQWKLVKEYALLSYLPRPERARLWRLERTPAERSTVFDGKEDLTSLRGIDDPALLFRSGMERYDANDHAAARQYFRKLLPTTTPEGENAAFFYAATFYRQGDWARARHEFKRLLRRDRHGRWEPAAYWHLATCEKNLGRTRRARRLFAMIVRRFPNDPSTTTMAARDLTRLERRRGGVLVDWWRSWRGLTPRAAAPAGAGS
jgi:tetratricopeptide (TPR) repeat protein